MQLRPRLAPATAALLSIFAALGPGPASAGTADELRAWMQSNPDDVAWLEAGTEQAPRAYVDLEADRVTVIFKLPAGADADDIVKAVMNYDVYRRTADVETSFRTDGAFFTGTRVMGYYSPTVTGYSVVRDGDALDLSWQRLSDERTQTWLVEHRADLQKALELAGKDHDEGAVDEYLEETLETIDRVAGVVGSHQYVDGVYRYSQELVMGGWLVSKAAQSLGRTRQAEASLKAACYSTGQFTWAGPAGGRGKTFQTRGNVKDSLTPGE